VSAAPTQPPEAPKGTKQGLIEYATQEAVEAHISPSTVRAVIDCETGGTWNPEIVGDHGMSFGLSQIYLPDHPDISRETAEDPYFAIQFLVRSVADGHGSMWSCYRELY
jgi:hypothetical protein